MVGVLTGIALVIIAVLLFELLILFHEGGHFLTAKKSGVQVNEFSLGMGPKIFGFKKGETQYSFRLFPIGGYCAMEGEDDESDNPRAFINAKVWKRMIIIVAGAFMNIVLGLLMMFVLVVQMPIFSSTTISDFSANSYSANCGLEKGDKILKFNNYDIVTFQDLSFAVATMKPTEVDGHSVEIYKQDCANELYNALAVKVTDKKTDYGEKTIEKAYSILLDGCDKVNQSNTKAQAKAQMETYYGKIQETFGIEKYKIPKIKEKDTRQRFRTDVIVERDKQVLTLKDVDLFTYLNTDEEKPSVSIDFYVEGIEKNLLTVLQQTGLQTVSVVRMVWTSLAGLVTGQFSITDVSGPVGAATAITKVASAGLENSFLSALNNILYMMMLISINLGIFNMLPFPALDGGRFLFLLIEAVFRKPIPRKAEAVINSIGLGLLLVFIFLITVKDIWQLF